MRGNALAASATGSFLLGEPALYSLLVLVPTGTWLTLFFEPGTKSAPDNGSYLPLDGLPVSMAYNSTLHITFDVRGGQLIRQMHRWARDLGPLGPRRLLCPSSTSIAARDGGPAARPGRFAHGRTPDATRHRIAQAVSDEAAIAAVVERHGSAVLSMAHGRRLPSPDPGAIMSVGDEYRSRARELESRAREWKEAAERATDPEQRKRLTDKARRAHEQSEQAGRMAGQGLDPV
ncbi:DUF6381 family protein [Streptomyces hundungensis]|uniref:DUF6381 family protein n=1 Tax=Streptomyces hundungensis TaxID=1077946 RepID=UPI0033DD8DA8